MSSTSVVELISELHGEVVELRRNNAVVPELTAEVLKLRAQNEALRAEIAELKKVVPRTAVPHTALCSLLAKTPAPPQPQVTGGLQKSKPTRGGTATKSSAPTRMDPEQRRAAKAQKDRDRRARIKQKQAAAAAAALPTKRKRTADAADAASNVPPSNVPPNLDSIPADTMAALMACEEPMDVVYAIENTYPQCKVVYTSAAFWTRWKRAHAECQLSTAPDDVAAMVAAFREEGDKERAPKKPRTESVRAGAVDGIGHDDVATERDEGLGFVDKIRLAHDD